MADTCGELVQGIINGEKDANHIINIEEILLAEDVQLVKSCINAVRTLFLHFLEKNEMCVDETYEIGELNAQQKYRVWLKERYDDIKKHLLDYLHHDEVDVQLLSLDVLLEFVVGEGKHPLKKVAKGDWYFPRELYQNIISYIIQNDTEGPASLIKHLQNYLDYDDVKLYTLKSIASVIQNIEMTDELIVHNIYLLLSKVRYPLAFPDKDPENCVPNAFVSRADSESFLLNENTFKSKFSAVWMAFLKLKLSRKLHQQVLKFLPKRVLPHITNPLLLTDFFTDSYNAGGIISLLALSGIFFLIQNCNLEYPDFYIKLYALFHINVIGSKYKANFFYLSDSFLSSILLPEYLVAAFVKKLTRLTLYAKPDVLLIMLPFIGNLLIRHPNLKVLFHQPSDMILETDPYNFEEPDPSKCNALQSSLWEIKSLQTHWHPDISTKANFINSELPISEWDLSSVLDTDFEDMLERENTMQFKEYPMSYHKPMGLFNREEDQMSAFWTL